MQHTSTDHSQRTARELNMHPAVLVKDDTLVAIAKMKVAHPHVSTPLSARSRPPSRTCWPSAAPRPPQCGARGRGCCDAHSSMQLPRQTHPSGRASGAAADRRAARPAARATPPAAGRTSPRPSPRMHCMRHPSQNAAASLKHLLLAHVNAKASLINIAADLLVAEVPARY